MNYSCDKCHKKFKFIKSLTNHQTKYPDCLLLKYECVKCKYSTNSLFNYNKHLITKIHLLNTNVCVECKKEFRDKHDYNRHLNRKNKCVAVIENNDAKSIINNISYNIIFGSS